MKKNAIYVVNSFAMGLFQRSAILLVVTVVSGVICVAGERLIIQCKDFTQTEVKSGGFKLSSEMKIHVRALGAGGERNLGFSSSEMYAYGWIINADSRELVWRLQRSNTTKENKERKFDGDVLLPKGSYEVYFAAYGYGGGSAFANYSFNIDRRKENPPGGKSKRKGFFDWFVDIFSDDVERDWKRRAKDWGIELYVDDKSPEITMFSVPKEFSNIMYKATKLGEGEHIRQQFVLSKPTAVRIYALGERDNSQHLADYGWIVDAKTHKRVWEMLRDNLQPAGGAEKNVKFDEVVSFPAGEFTLYYNTDDSHSFVDWNAPPPEDLFNYGITLIAEHENEKGNFKLSSNLKEDKNIIAQLVRIGNDETRSSQFTLKEQSQVRIYALGEGGSLHRQMADYGWIINTRTRQKVWTMEMDRTENAGGAEKNRMVDEVITLPKGDYTVFYQTDDTHAYNDWNSSPPFDPEHWGITISGEGEEFKLANVEHNVSATLPGVIAQIVKVGNSAKKTLAFRLDKPTHVRIYAIGEGQNREMYDYGWIEHANNRTVVWEMTYSMTFHAGGDRKNRMVNTTMLLDKGEYVLHYVSDDSHSFNDWNMDPPDDPAMWGITLFEEKE
jgi:hypothetical protein